MVVLATKCYVGGDARERALDGLGSLIENAIGDSGADLVVMPSHARTGIERVLLGSVTEKVVRVSPVPVVTVPIRESDESDEPDESDVGRNDAA